MALQAPPTGHQAFPPRLEPPPLDHQPRPAGKHRGPHAAAVRGRRGALPRRRLLRPAGPRRGGRRCRAARGGAAGPGGVGGLRGAPLARGGTRGPRVNSNASNFSVNTFGKWLCLRTDNLPAWEIFIHPLSFDSLGGGGLEMALLGQPISPMPPSGESWLWEWNGMEPRVLLKLCQGHPRNAVVGLGIQHNLKS